MPRPLSADVLPPPAPAASLVLPTLATEALPPLQPHEPDTPVSAASVVSFDDVCSLMPDGNSSALGDGGSPIVSGDFLSQFFGEEERKIFQPFL